MRTITVLFEGKKGSKMKGESTKVKPLNQLPMLGNIGVGTAKRVSFISTLWRCRGPGSRKLLSFFPLGKPKAEANRGEIGERENGLSCSRRPRCDDASRFRFVRSIGGILGYQVEALRVDTPTDCCMGGTHRICWLGVSTYAA